MGRFLGGIFAGSQKQVSAPAIGARINTSLQGVPIPFLLAGQVRQGGNIVDYFGFQALTAQQAGQGGKGGVAGAGGGKGQQGQYVYSASFLLAFCAGPVAAVSTIFTNGAQDDIAGETGDFFLGSYSQLPWGSTEVEEPSHALAYRGLCYAAWAEYVLGNSPTLPNFTATITSSNFDDFVPGQPDGDPTVGFVTYLTDAFNGLQFPSGRIGTLSGTPSSWQSYCKALGLGVSWIITSQVTGSAPVTDILTATNSEAVWQDGLLTVIPYGDQAIAKGQITQISEPHTLPSIAVGGNASIQVGNFATFVADKGVAYVGGANFTAVDTYPTSPGTYYLGPNGTYWFSWQDAGQSVAIAYTWAATASYTPNTASVYDFTLDDYLPNQGTIGQGLSGNASPLAVVRKSRDLMNSDVRVEFLDRANNYNTNVIERKASAEIVRFGRQRTADTKQLHLFALASAAVQSCQLQLIRQQAVPRQYQWTVGGHFILVVGLMDVVTHTLAARNMLRRPVRVIEIQENQDGSLTYTGEDFPGTVSSPVYGTQATGGFGLNFNADPGAINTPIIFEPTDELAATFAGVPNGGLCIAVAVSGQNTALYRGCNVLASYSADGPFTLVGTIDTPSRMGVLTAQLAGVAVNNTGQTIDQTNTLSVDLTESAASLDSGTVLDATSLNTRCIIGGEEVVAYETATLTATSKYNLTYLVRGAYGTEDEIATWPIGTSFARLDAGVVAFPFDQSRIGSKVYIKFQAFNVYGGGAQDVSTLTAYPYTIIGAALASPLPNVANLRTVFDAADGFQHLWWDEVTDFRPGIRYLIKKGTAYAGAQQIADVAHADFPLFGPGTYWVTAYCQPVAGLLVYSETPQSIVISGNLLVANLVTQIDFQALGWPGTFVDTGKEGTGPTALLRLSGAQNVLTETNILTDPDVLNSGGIAPSGTWTAAPSTWVDIGYVAQAYVNASWTLTGIPVGQNILEMPNILTNPDVLGSSSTQFVSGWLEIATATNPASDVYADADVFSEPDVYTADLAWGPWQRFVPGVYLAQYIKFQAVLQTVSGAVITYFLGASVQISVKPRIDHYQGLTVGTGGITITFVPDTQSAAAPFNGGILLGGTSNAPLPFVQVTGNPAGTAWVQDSLTLAQLTGHFEDSTHTHVSVGPNVNITVEGY